MAIYLLFPAIYKYLQKQHINKVQAFASLLAAISLLPLTTSKQLLDHPYYQVRAPFSLLPGAQQLAISGHMLAVS